MRYVFLVIVCENTFQVVTILRENTVGIVGAYAVTVNDKRLRQSLEAMFVHSTVCMCTYHIRPVRRNGDATGFVVTCFTLISCVFYRHQMIFKGQGIDSSYDVKTWSKVYPISSHRLLHLSTFCGRIMSLKSFVRLSSKYSVYQL